MTDDHWYETNLFHRHFRILFVSLVIIYDISRKLHLGIEKFDMQTFFMNHRMLLWKAEPLNNADLKLWNVLSYSKEKLHHTQTSGFWLCPFVPNAFYKWHSIQLETLFTAKGNYFAVLVLFSLSGTNDDWAMRRVWSIAPGALKKIDSWRQVFETNG